MSNIARRKFLQLCGALGLPLALQSELSAAEKSAQADGAAASSSVGSVLIIGAGAAGLSAGYLLAQAGVDFKILEAAPSYGGRMKRTTNFTDFPIPLGAEWLHAGFEELVAIVNDASVEITTELRGYEAEDSYGFFEQGELTRVSFGDSDDFDDLKFVGSTWLDFFDEYIVPPVQSKIQFDTQIVAVDYHDNDVVVRDQDGNSYAAEKLIITVPIKILQDGGIRFTPPLPEEKLEAIEYAPVWGGIKVFLEFSESFYPTFLEFPDSETSIGQRAYYDASYGQNSDAHVLGLFAVGEQAKQYQARSGDAQRDFILAELDDIFDGAASNTYIQHLTQNWSDEPFIQAAYLADVSPSWIPRVLSKPVDGKLFFAGEAYTQSGDWAAVHNAAQSARDAVRDLTG